MSRVLKNFPLAPSNLTRTEKATYSWDLWFDGRVHKLEQGKDFYPHPLMMERIIRTRATGRGAKVRLRHEAKDKTDELNPFGYIILQRTDIEYSEQPSENGQAPAATKATKAPTKATARKAPAKKATAKNGSKATPAKAPAAKATKAPAEKAAPTAKAPAKRTRKAPATKAVAKPTANGKTAAKPTKAPSKKRHLAAVK